MSRSIAIATQIVALVAAGAVPAHPQGIEMPAGELARQVIAREVVAANVGGHYMYEQIRTTPRRTETRAIVETRDWSIGRLIRINGTPLTSEQQRLELQRLAELQADTAELFALQQKLHHDEQRVRRIMAAMPEAFEYSYSEAVADTSGRGLVRLSFRPRKAFVPANRELAVLTGMEGTMQIDTVAGRLVRIEGTLTRDVTFGWGVFGRLKRGGYFLLEQRNVGSARWAISSLRLRFTGKVLLVKTITIDSETSTSNFRRMADDLSLEEGLARLRAEDVGMRTP